ncbi:MAG: alpha,alpha-trehalase TreF [Bacteroidota bacterium]
MNLIRFACISSILLLSACRQAPTLPEAKAPASTPVDPEAAYGELFRAVQLAAVFPDSKTFTDCTAKSAAKDIREAYQKEKDLPGFDLTAFVLKHFDKPRQYASGFQSDSKRTVDEHINALWPVLTRQADSSLNGSTLLPLPKSYIVPGGRFGEIYYWDSYFTILGLQAAGKMGMVRNMADNFAYLIDTVGFVPNGNRTYFLGRSQPPFFSLIVRVLAEVEGEKALLDYLPQLQKEYNFWMNGRESQLSDGTQSFRRVVRINESLVMNRYWDDRPAPRPESYKEDVELVEGISDRPAERVYRDLRAACESGWDFSSRWFKDAQYLASIHTTDILPVDQNALLYHLEGCMADAYRAKGDSSVAQQFDEAARKRKEGVAQFCWDEKAGFFVDYDFVQQQPTGVHSLAGMFPLFFKMASAEQAERVAEKIEKYFLKAGGVVTTLNNTGQQWDAPNGWAPLQWITIQGLRNYGHDELANSIRQRWIDLNNKVYKNTGKMVEKYNVEDMGLEAGGGEYPVQDGFGWTNGVLLKLLMDEPMASSDQQ